MKNIQDTKVSFYAFPMSQPCRAIHGFLIHCNIPHEYKFIDLMQQQQKSPEYLAINPKAQVPAIRDSWITLSESTAILRYLSRNNRHLVDENLYPINIVRCAKVDELLDWFQGNFRKNSTGVMFNKVFAKLIGVPPESDQAIQNYEKGLALNLEQIENQQLRDSDYLANNQLSVADFLLAAEIFSLIQAQYNFQNTPRIKAWLKRMFKLPGFLKGLLYFVIKIIAHEKYFEMIKEQHQGIINEFTQTFK